MITSLLDNDAYKFTMAQAVLHNYPDAWVRYKFKCRNGSVIPEGMAPIEFCDKVNIAIDTLCELRAHNDELLFLDRIPYIKPDFVEYFRLLQLNRNYVRCFLEKDELAIIVEGPWISTIWFEVPLLYIVSELRHHYTKIERSQRESTLICRTEEKIQWLLEQGDYVMGLRFADFGTRRRLSHRTHRIVLEILKEEIPDLLIGTSNMYFAKNLNLKPIGTMAHEWLQAHQQLGVRIIDSQKAALDCWVREYRGQLGIALTDVVGMDAFCRDFDLFFAKLFDGGRHDSGDPKEWGYKLINHYKSLGIDSQTKSAVWSDGLDFPKSLSLFIRFRRFIDCSFGIGTHLTNDTLTPALQIVMKMTYCNRQPVAKISDSPGKGMCEDPEYLSYLKKVFKIKGDKNVCN